MSGFQDVGGGLAFNTNMAGTMANSTAAAPLGLATNPNPSGSAVNSAAPTAAPTPTVAAPAAPVDRVKLATDTFNNLAGQRQSQFDADQRDNIRSSAAMGQIASGGLRTREGNLRLARDRDLDALQKDLTLKATEGSIADAQTAYGQALAGSQQNLAAELGRGGLDVQRGALDLEKENAGLNAALAKAGLTGLLEGTETLAAKQQRIQQAVTDRTLSQEDAKIALAQLAQQTGASQAQQQIDLQKTGQEAQIAAQLKGLSLEEAKLELDKQVQTGQLTIQQANLALAAKEQAEASGVRTEQLGLAKTGQEADIAARLQGLSLEQAKLELDKQVQTGQLSVQQANQALAAKEQAEASGARNTQLNLAGKAQAFAEEMGRAGLTLDQQKQAMDEKVRTGELTIAQRDGWLREVQLNVDAERSDRALVLQKQQIENQASQFGASQAQQLALAKLADATANREIDVRTEQGANALLLELARIMGGPSGNVDPKFIQAIASSLGVAAPGQFKTSQQVIEEKATDATTTANKQTQLAFWLDQLQRSTSPSTRDAIIVKIKELQSGSATPINIPAVNMSGVIGAAGGADIPQGAPEAFYYE